MKGRAVKEAGARMKTLSAAVVGAGSWGTTLADLLARKGSGSVRLWARNPELAGIIEKTRENPAYLPGIKLSDNIGVTNSLADALKGASLVVCAVPSHGIREVFKDAPAHIPKDAIIVSASKGIEEATNLTSSQILRDVLPQVLREHIVIFSGPTFAKEVARHLPSAACAASRINKDATVVQEAFSTPYFRIYTNPDPAGVELGGTLKNVIAIACGISDGLGLGSNARAALITRGLSEISRLGVKMKADIKTFYGLSGLGDLVLTSTGALSRNHAVGVEIGKGRKLKEILSGMRMVAEGVKTSLAVRRLSHLLSVEMPITEAVCAVLYEDKSPRQATVELMTRELKEEL